MGTTKKMNAAGWYAKACGFDSNGLEEQAEPCYAMVYKLGWRALPGKERPGFFVGYGSTLRNNRKLARSAAILREGVRLFPRYAALKVFLALTLRLAGKYKAASDVLLKACLDMPQGAFDGYERAIKHYEAADA